MLFVLVLAVRSVYVRKCVKLVELRTRYDMMCTCPPRLLTGEGGEREKKSGTRGYYG